MTIIKVRPLPLTALALAATLALCAHPMGNRSVSHYARFDVTRSAIHLTYILHLAEVPTYQLQREGHLDPQPFLANLDFGSAHPTVDSARITILPAAGGLNTARLEAHLTLPAAPLDYEDRNFPDRPGWKEIVIASTDHSLAEASQSSNDRSLALTQFPGDPPQDLRARLIPGSAPSPKLAPIPQPAPPPSDAPAPPPSAPVEKDYLTRTLSQPSIPPDIMLIALAVAFAAGALHARSPGHGKTMVAAYLVGSRGTMKHAAILGATVTITHTISVFALGLLTLAFARTVPPERLSKILGTASGLAILIIGALLFFQRLRGLHHAHPHGHTHDHDHPHDHSPRSLLALGISGGLVPCPSALVLLLIAISAGHIAFGLLMLVSFSLGLAAVLMAIGMFVIYARHWLPDPKQAAAHPLFRYLPVLSAFFIFAIGAVMTAASLLK